jgi:hypothetical protein
LGPVIVHPAHNGEPTASAGDIRIHSSYNPGQEAERFLKGYPVVLRDRGTVVVIGAGLGYIDWKLRELKSDAEIIAIHLDVTLHASRINRGPDGPGVKRWYPGAPRDVDTFLAESLPETSVGGLQVLVWPPSVRAFPDAAKNAQEALARIVRYHSGNLSSTAAFGRLWLRNCLRNFVSMNLVAVPVRCPDPVVLAASGPGLENVLPILKRHRPFFRLWALPSSLAALADSNIVPDLVIAADPGFWARIHGRYLPRNCPVAMPLTAAPLPEGGGPPMPLHQGTPCEAAVIQETSWPVTPLPAMGTVAATAIELWKRISTGRLIITGLDLSWHDLRGHVRPHSFDGWLSGMEGRTSPKQEILRERAAKAAPKRHGLKRTGPTLQTYADWFGSGISGGRAVMLGSGGIAIPGVPVVDNTIMRGWKDISGSGPYTNSLAVTLSPEYRRERIRKTLADWIKRLTAPIDSMDADILDLMYMLDPGGVHDIKRSSEPTRHEAEQIHRERVHKILDEMASTYGR